jgi:hypothetical protein
VVTSNIVLFIFFIAMAAAVRMSEELWKLCYVCL